MRYFIVLYGCVCHPFINGYDDDDNPSLICHLCKLFNLMLKHCYVPNDFGRGIVIPLIKDKRGNVNDSANYSVSPVISKIFKLCLMDKFNEFLASSHLQIGFKKNLGCASGLFPMQNTVDYLYIATVYASKTFDRVDHKVLFQKLVNRGAPRCFVGVLRSWYGKLVSSVQWNGVLVQIFVLIA